jgi:hemolysin III
MSLLPLAHNENATYLTPRHPVVCGIDAIGFLATAWLLVAYTPSFWIATLPLIVMLQYCVSFCYHYLPHHIVRQKLDHQAIVLLAGGTFVPYWVTLLVPGTELYARLLVLMILTIAVSAVRWFFFSAHRIGGFLYLMLAATPLSISFYELTVWFDGVGVTVFWFGIACYFINYLVHASKWPDIVPKLFGYREVQHVFIFLGTTTQVWVLLRYIS